MLKCLIAFILGWFLCKHMGNGFSVGGMDWSLSKIGKDIIHAVDVAPTMLSDNICGAGVLGKAVNCKTLYNIQKGGKNNTRVGVHYRNNALQWPECSDVLISADRDPLGRKIKGGYSPEDADKLCKSLCHHTNAGCQNSCSVDKEAGPISKDRDDFHSENPPREGPAGGYWGWKCKPKGYCGGGTTCPE